MSVRASRLISWSMWLLGVVMIVLGAVLAEINPPVSTMQPNESVAEGVIWLSTWVGFGLVGALVVSSRPHNRIGWIMCGITLTVGFDQFVAAYSRFVLVTEPGRWPLGEQAAWLSTWTFFPVMLLVAGLVVLYPSGMPSRFGRRILQAFLVVSAIDILVYALRPGPVRGDTPPDNPLGIPGVGHVLDPVTEWLGTILGAIALLAVVDLILRFRHSSGVERLQFRWFVLAAAAFPVMFFGGILLEEFVIGVDGFDPVVLAFAIWGNGTAAAIGIAITRHGLYEINRVISRTVGYVLVVGVLGALYFGAISFLTYVLPAESQIAVAASTLGVAALFNPVRRVLLGRVDRHFNRTRYDAERVMAGFTGSLRDEVDSDCVVTGWVSVVSETMHPASAGVWVRGQS
jgi:hypothetical protein